MDLLRVLVPHIAVMPRLIDDTGDLAFDRTQEYQEKLFQNKVDRLIAQGYSEADAPVEAGKSVAVPGTSEHQLGLAVDIVDINNQHLDETQESTAVQKWIRIAPAIH